MGFETIKHRFRMLSVATLLLGGSAFPAQPNAQEIVQRSAAATEANWKQETAFTYVDRDLQVKEGSKALKTFRVIMIEGSPYYRTIADGDRPITPAQDRQEAQKLKAEIEKRRHESSKDRAKRMAQYQKEQTQRHVLVREMARAFDYKLVGEERVGGRDAFVLEATPRRGYHPMSREAKILTGMRGKLWIDKNQYQWLKAEAEVVKPVSFFWNIAKVGRGTRFLLEQEPVSAGVWMPKHFRMEVNATTLGKRKSYLEDDTYRDYRPAGRETLAELR